jgi:predicted nucleic acid-binding protein
MSAATTIGILPAMNRLVLADTGPLYALADPSDQYHLRAQTQQDRISATKRFVAVAYPTLTESYTLVLRRLGTVYAHQWLEQVMDATMLINPEPGDYVRAATLLVNFPDQSITLFDAVVATLSERLQVAVWTYDRGFDLLGIKRWA